MGLRGAAPALQVTGIDAGLHLVANLPPGTNETVVQQRLYKAGLAVDVATWPITGKSGVIIGLGCGLIFGPAQNAATGEVKSHEAGMASAVVNTAPQAAAAAGRVARTGSGLRVASSACDPDRGDVDAIYLT